MEAGLTFSIIIPTYNRRDKILKCLETLYNQDFPAAKYEIIVVDDASTDGTYQKLAKEDVAVYKLKSRVGPAAARNYGASKAKGKYLAFIDSDCLAPSNWLERLLDGYRKLPAAVGVGGSYEQRSKSILAQYEAFVYRKYLKKQKDYVSTQRDELPFILGNMSYVRGAFLEVGGLNEKIPYYCAGEDAELKERLLKAKKKFVYVDCKVVHDHDFTFSSFYTQSLNRGAGMLWDSRKKGKIQSLPVLYLRLLFSLCLPISLLYSLIQVKGSLKLVFPEYLFFVFRTLGKLKHYKEIANLSI